MKTIDININKVKTEEFRQAYYSFELTTVANMFNIKYDNLYYMLYRSIYKQELQDFLKKGHNNK